MSSPSLLLFDLGGVLVDISAFGALTQLSAAAPDADAVKRRWLASPAVRRFELGLDAPDDFARAFVAEWQLALAPQEFLARFAAWPRGLYPGAREILRALRRRFRVACLSNSNALHWERFGSFVGEFDLALSSHLLGAIKPDADAFERALERCGARAAETVFFDDSPHNVAVARELGLRAHHVDGIEALLPLLRAEGLLME